MRIEDTIDAFVDGMTVEPHALDAALASPEGRAYLLDVLALRGLMRDEPIETAPPKPKPSWSVLGLARAAVIAITLLGAGYAAGYLTPERTKAVATESTDRDGAPEPTRVIELNDLRDLQGGD